MRHIQQDRVYRYKNIRLQVKKGVFHPGLFFSTRFLLQELEKEQLAGKRVLELGAGSGLLSFYAASQGAEVTATDINPTAIEGLHVNREQLQRTQAMHINILLSDLFASIPPQPFDYILINPPYYPKDPVNEEEKAWYCGASFQYFKNLFAGIHPYVQPYTQVWLSVSEDCDLETIRSLAQQAKLDLYLKAKKYFWGEKNMIFWVR